MHLKMLSKSLRINKIYVCHKLCSKVIEQDRRKSVKNSFITIKYTFVQLVLYYRTYLECELFILVFALHSIIPYGYIVWVVVYFIAV